MRKTFVLDTNVLLHNADCLESFADNTVVIPMAVLEELDKFKTSNNELGRNARQVIRRLDSLRLAGSLRDGVPIPSGGEVRIVPTPFDKNLSGLDDDIPDNRIIQLAYVLHREQEQPITFVSKDINARIKADSLGISVADFEREKINFDELYSGYTEMDVRQDILDGFFDNVTIPFDEAEGLFPNAFIRLSAGDSTNENGGTGKKGLGRLTGDRRLRHLNRHYASAWNITARNKEQRLALELLLDPDVQIVTLVGQAGTGKTLLAVAAALQTTVKNHTYDRILVSRPIVPLGKDIGYLPGPKEEKLSHWMQPIFDNLHYLMREKTIVRNKKRTRVLTLQEKVDKLIADGTLTLEALTYIRGRSIPRQYVIVDEAQNLTPHEVKTIVSRAGEGTKMVLTGDPYQIDNPYLDASSNGLTYAAERLKKDSIHGHMTLLQSERSPLAALAAENL